MKVVDAWWSWAWTIILLIAVLGMSTVILGRINTLDLKLDSIQLQLETLEPYLSSQEEISTD